MSYYNKGKRLRNSETFSEETISLPVHSDINKKKIDFIISKIKDDMDEVFGLDSNPFDFSCWDCTNDGCDPTIYESILDDGTIHTFEDID